MNKLYTVVLIDKKEYEIFKTWDDCKNYMDNNSKSKVRLATFKETEDGMKKLIEFVNYCFKGTTYKGSMIADSKDAVIAVVTSRTLKNKKYASWTIHYNQREVFTFINMEYPCTEMTIEQEGIIDLMKEISSLFPQGTEILLGVQQDYLVNMFLDFNKPSSKKSKYYEQELNKYSSDYILEIVKSENYIDTKDLMTRIKNISKGEK